jgi:hypothetical protein
MKIKMRTKKRHDKAFVRKAADEGAGWHVCHCNRAEEAVL